MKAEEIRKRQSHMHDVDRGEENDFQIAVCFWLSELAAQLAEANEHLKKIANPLLVMEESPWVKLAWHTQSVLVKASSVEAVFTAHDRVGIRLLGANRLEECLWSSEPFSEVCAKLGISVEGQ